jgi:hypothetical protein
MRDAEAMQHELDARTIFVLVWFPHIGLGT